MPADPAQLEAWAGGLPTRVLQHLARGPRLDDPDACRVCDALLTYLRRPWLPERPRGIPRSLSIAMAEGLFDYHQALDMGGTLPALKRGPVAHARCLHVYDAARAALAAR